MRAPQEAVDQCRATIESGDVDRAMSEMGDFLKFMSRQHLALRQRLGRSLKNQFGSKSEGVESDQLTFDLLGMMIGD